MRNFLLLLICINIIAKNGPSKEFKKTIHNGHIIEESLENEIYIGQPISEIISMFGKPFCIQQNKYFFFVLKRKAYPIPIKGRIINGRIIKIITNNQGNVESIEKKEYKSYSSQIKNILQNRIKTIEKTKIQKEKHIESIKKDYKEKQKQRKENHELKLKEKRKQAKKESKK